MRCQAHAFRPFKTGQGRTAKRIERHYLEQLPHLPGIEQAVERAADIPCLRRRGRALQGRRPCLDTEAAQEVPLRHRAMALDARRRTAQGFEIHVRGQIGQTRIGVYGLRPVCAHRLQRIAIGALNMALVDNQRGAAFGVQACRNIGHVTLARRRLFEYIADVARPVEGARRL